MIDLFYIAMDFEIVYTHKKSLGINYEKITITLPNNGKHSICNPL